MKKILFIIALFACAIAVGCQPAKLSDTEKGQIASEIKQSMKDYVNAVKSKDIEYLLNFWGDYDDFVHAGDGSIFGGYKEWSEFLKRVNKEVDEWLHYDQSDIHIIVLDRNAAASTFNFDYSFTPVLHKFAEDCYPISGCYLQYV